MTVSAMELALARLAIQTNMELSGTIVTRILNLVESGKQTFTVDELFSNVVQVAVDYVDEQQNRSQANYQGMLLADLFDTPNEINLLAKTEDAVAVTPLGGLRFETETDVTVGVSKWV